MAYPMIALTTAGTTFACASVSLTETGLAVLNENGSRTGFVPYDSLEYVAPTEEASVSDPPMRVLTEDGSTFGAASISQTSAGVAVLDASGARIGFVPYDTLTYVLPESKTGPTLPADATPVDGVNIEEEDDGGSPVWEDDDEAEEGGEAEDEGDNDGAADDESEETGDDEGGNEDRGEDGEEHESDGETEADDGESEEEDDQPVWDDDPVAESDRDGEAEDGSGSESDDDGQTSDDSSENEEREEAEESELVVDWSFGDE